MLIRDLIQGELTDYILEEDSFKDGNGRGFIERYLEIFGEELDTNSVVKIEELDTKLIDLELTDVEYLPYFEAAYGNITRFDENERIRRNILKYLIYIWSIVGTKKAIRAILASIGFKVDTITELPFVEIRYDSGARYDEDTTRYDEFCPGCGYIDLELTRNNSTTVTTTDIQTIGRLLRIVLPEDVRVNDLTVNNLDLNNLITAIYLDSDPAQNIANPEGDLFYDEDDPLGDIELTINEDGDLIIDGVDASSYSLNENGDLIFTFNI